MNVFSVGQGLIAACTSPAGRPGPARPGRRQSRAVLAASSPPRPRTADPRSASCCPTRPGCLPSAVLLSPRRPAVACAGHDRCSGRAGRPVRGPGTQRHADHVNTVGFLAGEVIRRLTRTTVGFLPRHGSRGPLSADVLFVLAASERDRVASVFWPGPPPAEARTPPAAGLARLRRRADVVWILATWSWPTGVGQAISNGWPGESLWGLVVITTSGRASRWRAWSRC